MSLKDELLKAKLISKKDLSRIEHEKRVEKKQLGKDGLKEKKKNKDKELQAKQREKQEKDKQIAQEKKQQQQEKDKKKRIEKIIEKGIVSDNGPRKFYFIDKDNKIPFLMVSDDMSRKLTDGKAAIIQKNRDFFIIDRESAEKLYKEKIDCLLFYNGRG